MIYTLGNRIRMYRKMKRLSQKQLGGLIGVDRSTISQYENDLRQPSFNVLILLSEVMGVTTDELLGKRCVSTVDVTGLRVKDVELIVSLVERLRGNYGEE